MLRHHALKTVSKGPPLSFSYLTTLNGNTSASETFTSVSFGDAEPTRRIYIVVIGQSNTSGATISSVTIGGVTATLTVEKTSNGSGSPAIAGIAVVDLPTGATGSVVVTFSTALTVAKRLHIYRVLNQKAALNSVVLAAGRNANILGTSGSRTATSEAGGFAIGGVGWFTARDATVTSAGWTRNTQGSAVNQYASIYTSGGNLTVSWSWSGSTQWAVSLYTFRA